MSLIQLRILKYERERKSQAENLHITAIYFLGCAKNKINEFYKERYKNSLVCIHLQIWSTNHAFDKYYISLGV